MTKTIKVRFSKKALMVFISHLDLLRLFQRAARRAGLPLEFTKGFNPRPRISIQKALKLGLESDSLEAIFMLDRDFAAPEFKERMNQQLPKGIKIEETF